MNSLKVADGQCLSIKGFGIEFSKFEVEKEFEIDLDVFCVLNIYMRYIQMFIDSLITR